MLRRSVSLAGLAVLLAVTPACVLIDDFDKFAEGTPDAGPGGLDASADAEVDAFVPDEDAGPDCGPEICNGEDDDCDGSTDEEPTECSFPNAVVGCVDGACAQVGCEAGFEDCTDAPGCETDILTSLDACGSCTNSCGARELCVAGTCGPPAIRDVLVIGSDDSVEIEDAVFDATGALSLALTASGTVMMPGRTVALAQRSAVFAQLDPTRTATSWATAMSATGVSSARALVLTPTGEIFGIGDFRGVATVSGTPYDAAPSNPAGFLWGFQSDGSHRSFQPLLAASSVTPAGVGFVDGNALVFGSAWGNFEGRPSLGMSDAFATRHSPSGTGPTVRTYGGAGPDGFRDSAIGSDGTIAVIGDYQGPASFGGPTVPADGGGDADVIIAIYDDFDTIRWTLGFGSNGYDTGSAIGLDDAGNVYTSALVANPVDLGGGPSADLDTFFTVIASHSPDGTFRWMTPLRNIGIAGIVGAGSEVYLVGSVLDADVSPDFDVPFGGTLDGVVLALSSGTGEVRWIRTWGGLDREAALGATLDADRSLWVFGYVDGTVDLDGSEISAAGNRSSYLFRLSTDGT